MEYQDQLITCAGCGTEFLHTASEREFMTLTFDRYCPPKRCKRCRVSRRIERERETGGAR